MTDWPIGAQTAQASWSFEALAQDVLSLDASIEWITLEQAGREVRWGWRDTSSGRVRTAVGRPPGGRSAASPDRSEPPWTRMLWDGSS
jgi:hypothetical protein